MRFLIVDDDEWKTSALRAFLLDQGVGVEKISCADCVVDARRMLSSGAFDIMLLDVLLPVRRGATPSGQNSIELIREIVDDGAVNAPRYIVGVTADLAAMEVHGPEFQRMTMNVILVAPGENAWTDFLENLVVFVRRVDGARDRFDYDVCVLNALKSPELDSVIACWPVSLGSEKLLNSNVLFREGVCEIGSGERRMVCGYPSQMGPVAAVQAATAMLGAFKPRIILMTGICGGFSDYVSVGDVVVAEKSWDWQSGKWATGDPDSAVLELRAAPDQRSASPELLAHARTIQSEELLAMSRAYDGSKPSNDPKLVFGPMVTGSSVVASLDIQRVFRGQHRKMVAVDMECYGVYYAVALSEGAQSRVICVKAVSDLADRGKVDDFQLYCSYLSAAVGLEVLRRYYD